LLNNIVKLLPTIRETSQSFLRDLNLQAAKANEEANLWSDPDKYPDLQDAKDVRLCSLKIILTLIGPVYQYMRERAGWAFEGLAEVAQEAEAGIPDCRWCRGEYQISARTAWL
jgi:hypothetical protein